MSFDQAVLSFVEKNAPPGACLSLFKSSKGSSWSISCDGLMVTVGSEDRQVSVSGNVTFNLKPSEVGPKLAVCGAIGVFAENLGRHLQNL